jgi:hypothetical protein
LRRAVGHGTVEQASSVFVFPTVSNFMTSDCRESFAGSIEPNLATRRCREVQRIDDFKWRNGRLNGRESWTLHDDTSS